MVGGPGSTVTFSRSTRSSTCATSKTGTGMMVAPRIRDVMQPALDRKSTRLNSSHQIISYAVFCLKKKKQELKSQCTRKIAARSTCQRKYHDSTAKGLA